MSPEQFSKFSLPYLKKIAAFLKTEIGKLNLPTAVPLIVFAKGAHYAVEELAQLDYDVVSLDWTMRPTNARRVVGNRVTLQGNLDPCAIYSADDDLIAETRRMLQAFGCQRYVANLGHGIYPDMEPERVKTFVNAVHAISEELIEASR